MVVVLYKLPGKVVREVATNLVLFTFLSNIGQLVAAFASYDTKKKAQHVISHFWFRRQCIPYFRILFYSILLSGIEGYQL